MGALHSSTPTDTIEQIPCHHLLNPSLTLHHENHTRARTCWGPEDCWAGLGRALQKRCIECLLACVAQAVQGWALRFGLFTETSPPRDPPVHLPCALFVLQH